MPVEVWRLACATCGRRLPVCVACGTHGCPDPTCFECLAERMGHLSPLWRWQATAHELVEIPTAQTVPAQDDGATDRSRMVDSAASAPAFEL